MNALPHPAQEPVDRHSVPALPDWSGHGPSTAHRVEHGPPVWHAWFTPLWQTSQGQPDVTAWRFTCPFCGAERKHDDYHETYASAYRHLSVCEWTGRDGERV